MVSERRCCIANPLINLLHLAAAQPGKMEGADKEARMWIPARPHTSGLKTHYDRGLHAALERRGPEASPSFPPSLRGCDAGISVQTRRLMSVRKSTFLTSVMDSAEAATSCTSSARSSPYTNPPFQVVPTDAALHPVFHPPMTDDPTVPIQLKHH